MLALARQARRALRSPFVCTSCRALLASRAPLPLPGAIVTCYAVRHHSSSGSNAQTPSEPLDSQAEQSPENRRKFRRKRKFKGFTQSQEAKDGLQALQSSGQQNDSEQHQISQPLSQSQEQTDKTDKNEKNDETDSNDKSNKNDKSKKPEESSSGRSEKKIRVRMSSRRIHLWKETLQVLKNLQAQQQALAAAQSSVAARDSQSSDSADAGSAGSDALSNKGASGRLERNGSVSPVSTPLGSDPFREAKLLEGALAVLRRVLHQEAQLSLPTGTEATSSLDSENPAGDAKPALKSPEPGPTADSPAPPPLKPYQQLRDSNDNRHLERFVVESVDSSKLELTPVKKPQPPVPRLAHGLDRVLFNPGVYFMQDPRSRVYNFDPYLARIMPVKEFDFNALKRYITSSKDTTLIKTATELAKKYTGSTSSMTSTLSHFHYLLSAWRPINPCMMSREFQIESFNYTRIMRAPAATFLHWKDGTYAIDADKEFDSANILSMLGKSMEKFLTLPKQDFEKYRKTKSDQLTDEERSGPESYHYTTMGDFMMRSQLDAFDPRLSGTGMFDLKTRAVVSIRMDTQNIHHGLGYEIRDRFGQWESFEREYYDMIRSAFLKYSLQVRMGRMDGIFVAFHNTERIFGFQYIDLPEMDLSLHGQKERNLGDREFKLSLHLLNKVLDKVTAKFPGKTLRLHFETRPGDPPFMYIFAKPVTPKEIEDVQGATQAAVEKFERRMMGVTPGPEPGLDEEDGGEDDGGEGAVEETIEESGTEEETSLAVWEDVMRKVEHALENEEQGVMSVREAIEYALKQSGLLESSSPDETERSVDAFLDALTGNSGSITPEDQAPYIIGRDQLVGGEGVLDKSKEYETAARTAQGASDTGGEHKPQLPAADGPSNKEPTLKGLILRLASQFRNMPNEQRALSGRSETQAQEDVHADTQRLHSAVKILSELIVQSREPEDAAKHEGNDVIETGSLSVEGGMEAKKVSETSAPKAAETSNGESAENDELYGLILTIRNKVDNEYVNRPENLGRNQRWVVEYAMEEIQPTRRGRLYNMLLSRRKRLLDPSDNTDDKWLNPYLQNLAELSQKGRSFRNRENARAKTYPVQVYGSEEPYSYESVFKGGGTRPYKVWEPERASKAARRKASPSQQDKDGDDNMAVENTKENVDEARPTGSRASRASRRRAKRRSAREEDKDSKELSGNEKAEFSKETGD
ncbi:Pet127-domain-containing protein [Canariomyces notabilis]|uniref:Pet127-domain-containing protein n=1 Tax=Canariomyces notabilis TaxID=2074819 RepID=A0AAN6TG19_9PEZI|nr:Pet127-domain-containing protein [Canariomyces arenarius]